MPTILLVEDDDWLAEMYSDALEVNKMFTVKRARTAEAALEILDANPAVGLIILDMFLPAHNGVEFLHELASYSDINPTPVVILSSVSQHDFAMDPERWKHYGVVQYLYKPHTKPQDLVASVKKQLSVKDAS